MHWREKVVSRKELSDKTLKLNVGEKVDTTFITDVLHSYGFEYVDYVYEPGQYAVVVASSTSFLLLRNILTALTFLETK